MRICSQMSHVACIFVIISVIKSSDKDRTRKRTSGELARDESLSAEQKIMRVMKSTLDWLQQEMVERFTRLMELNAKCDGHDTLSWKLSTRVRLMPLFGTTVRAMEQSSH